MGTQEFKAGPTDKRKDMIGNVIYEYIERIAGVEKAPKLTGMIIDLPEAELFEAVGTYDRLDQKIKVATDLLLKTQAEQECQTQEA